MIKLNNHEKYILLGRVIQSRNYMYSAKMSLEKMKPELLYAQNEVYNFGMYEDCGAFYHSELNEVKNKITIAEENLKIDTNTYVNLKKEYMFHYPNDKESLNSAIKLAKHEEQGNTFENIKSLITTVDNIMVILDKNIQNNQISLLEAVAQPINSVISQKMIKQSTKSEFLEEANQYISTLNIYLKRNSICLFSKEKIPFETIKIKQLLTELKKTFQSKIS